MDLSGFVGAVLLGSVILSVYTGGLGYIGSATGMSLDLLAQRSFGRYGSYLPSALISFTQIGWFGVGGAFTGKDDIFYVMIAQGLMIPALIVLGANIWTTNDNALYTSGLGLSNITKIRKRPMVLVAGIVGTVAAIWLYNNFIAFLNILNATLPPVGALVILDYFLHKDRYAPGVEVTKNVNWGVILAVVGGALVGNLVKWGIASVNAMAVACVIYLIFDKLVRTDT